LLFLHVIAVDAVAVRGNRVVVVLVMKVWELLLQNLSLQGLKG
jgi:hypothetical protein